MSKSNKQASCDPFIKELNKIRKKDEDAVFKIYSDLAWLETVAHDIRSGKGQSTLKVKKMKGQDFWQLTSGEYRIWYVFDENGVIHYLKVFKKQKNKTPIWLIEWVNKSKSKHLTAEELNVKALIKELENRRHKKKQKKK